MFSLGKEFSLRSRGVSQRDASVNVTANPIISPSNRRGRPVRAMLIFTLCLFLFVHLLPPMEVKKNKPVHITAGEMSESITVILTHAEGTTTHKEAVMEMTKSIRQKAWCSSSSLVASSVNLVLVFSFPMELKLWPETIPVGCVSCSSANTWHAWRVDLPALRSAEAESIVPCVSEVLLVFPREHLRDLSHSTADSGLGSRSFVGFPLMVKGALQMARRTEYFVVMAQFLSPLRENFMEKLLEPLGRNEGRVLAVQCAIVSSMHSIDNDNPPDEHLIVVDKGAFIGYSVLKKKNMLLPYILRRHNALKGKDARVRGSEVVDGVSPFCGVFHRRAFDSANGFTGWMKEHTVNTSLTMTTTSTNRPLLVSEVPDIIGWDLSMRLQEMYPTWQVWSSGALAILNSPLTTTSTTPIPITPLLSMNQSVFPAACEWGSRWFKTIERVQNRRYAVLSQKREQKHAVDAPLAPILFFARDYSCTCCGLMREMVGYLRPLPERYPVLLLGVQKNGYCSDAEGAEIAALQLTDESFAQAFFKTISHPDIWRKAYSSRKRIVIMHMRAHSYERALRAVQPRADYYIGRSLSESSLISPEWVHGMREIADEVWATGEFFRSVYKLSGVSPQKIHVVPEALNVNLYNPKDCKPLPLPLPMGKFYTNLPHLSPEEQQRRFRFLAVLKWELRKGWDVLLEAYWKAFGPSSPLHHNVSLYLKVKWMRVYSGNITDKNIHELLTNWAKKLPGFTSMDQFPHIVIVSGAKYLSEDTLRRLYCTVDAFILPTRCEGWGLPATEAMATGIPVLTTNWGGTTEFMAPNATFAIPIDGLEEVPAGLRYLTLPGNKWAIPSVNGTRDLMRYVVEHREHARAVGMRGRRRIEEFFSEEAVADLIDRRIATIAKKLDAKV
ncbi:mannosyltransferase-like protein [Trypanosoma theileri]|uniref:Mannosyltransferase-like protein n=1 Tax=Trypanosoma theileri TaxID=67003 RepID=A0A1X0NJI2_9TRYP|nr:mannosyltransferase-like protein [Trypanosoma theileri]ORC84934.1 mannosyltransferase-like protein [Trypanosoma theileri]